MDIIEVDENVHVINNFLDRVGMGRYQWQLWVLCGFGWIADQMLVQMLAIIQPRVQAEFNIDGYHVGGITASYFAGLAVGATFWGYGADIWGRKLAFNLTLLTAGIFGAAMGGQMSYAGLCGIATAMGTGTGGNLPLDGAIYLEITPRVNQRVLMLLSIYWCFGQRKDPDFCLISVFASLAAYAFLPSYSCTTTHPGPCLQKDNMVRCTVFITDIRAGGMSALPSAS